MRNKTEDTLLSDLGQIAVGRAEWRWRVVIGVIGVASVVATVAIIDVRISDIGHCRRLPRGNGEVWYIGEAIIARQN